MILLDTLLILLPSIASGYFDDQDKCNIINIKQIASITNTKLNIQSKVSALAPWWNWILCHCFYLSSFTMVAMLRLCQCFYHAWCEDARLVSKPSPHSSTFIKPIPGIAVMIWAETLSILKLCMVSGYLDDLDKYIINSKQMAGRLTSKIARWTTDSRFWKDMFKNNFKSKSNHLSLILDPRPFIAPKSEFTNLFTIIL